MAMNYNKSNSLVPPMSGMGTSMNMMSNSNPFSIQPGSVSSVMPNPITLVGGTLSGRAKDINIYIDAEMLSELWRKYDPTTDTQDPTCSFLQKHFAELNVLPRSLNQYPCKNFAPGITEQYVSVEYRILGRRETKKRNFRFYLDVNGNCRCEIVQTIPPDYTDRGSGPIGPMGGLGNPTLGGGMMPMGMTGTPNFTMVQPGTMSTVMPNPNAFMGGTISGRAKDMSIYIDAEMLSELWRKYDPTSDTNRPTCAFLQKHFAELNSLPRTLNQYPCKNFAPGITEQYVKVEYRLLGSRETETRNFRFYIDSNGNCRCEIVQTIPPDYTDRGSGPTDLGGPEDFGQNSSDIGIINTINDIMKYPDSYGENLISDYIKNSDMMIATDGSILPSVIDLVTTPSAIRDLNRVDAIRRGSTNIGGMKGSNFVSNGSYMNGSYMNTMSGMDYNQTYMERGIDLGIQTDTNSFGSLPTLPSTVLSSNFSTITPSENYQFSRQTTPVNEFPSLMSSGIQQLNTPFQNGESTSRLTNNFGTISSANYYVSPQSSGMNIYDGLPVNSYHRK